MSSKVIWKPSLFSLSLFLIASFWLPGSPQVQGFTFDDTVGPGEVLEQNLVLAGPVVVMDGVIEGDLVAVGDEVSINGEVDGSLVVVARKVNLNGATTGSAFVGALNLVLGPQATVERDVYFVGGRIETQADSSINRDLNVISLEANLSGSVGRDVNGLIGPLNLVQGMIRFMENQGWLPQTSQLPESRSLRNGFENQPILGMAFGQPFLPNFGPISLTTTGGKAFNAGPALQDPQQVGGIDFSRLQSWAVPLLRTLAALLIFGLLGIWLVPAQLSWAGEQARAEPWRMLLTGLLVFIVGWIAAFLAFVLILALALFLYWVSLPQLGFLAGTLGLTGLGLAVSIFWLSIAYFSKLIIAYQVGVLLFRRFRPGHAGRIWPLLIGVALYALLASIPYLGWLVAVLFTLSGLGALWMVSFPHGLPKRKSAEAPQAAGDNLDVSLLSEG